MNRSQILLILSTTIMCTQVFALSPEAIEGEKLYPACNVCHDQTMDPPLGPPMWGVQRRYKNSTLDDEDFVDSMVSFIKKPTLESARHNMAVERMGLMPPLPMENELLKKIATYILEEEFPPPCAHWAVGVKLSKEKGDIEHAQKDQRMLDRFCD